MTAEQQQMVVDNMHIVPIVIRKNGLYHSAKYYADTLGDAYLAMCKAAVKWEPGGTAKFSTYASKAICNEIYKQTKSKLIHNPRDPASIESYDGKYGESWHYLLRREITDYEQIEHDNQIDSIRKIASDVLRGESARKNRVFNAYINGRGTVNIAKDEGLSRKRVRNIIVEIYGKMRSIYFQKEV